MTTEITKKQAIMLVVLGIVLVLVVYVQLLIRPALSDASEKREEAAALQQQYETLLQQSESYEQNLQSLEAWNEESQGKTELLYPLSETYRIDRFLNFVIRECGASIISLSITDTQQYYVDGEGAIVLAAVDLLETENQESADSTSEGSGYTATGEYRADFSYTVEGSYSDLLQMMRFVNRLSFLGASSFSFEKLDSSTEEATEESAQTEDAAQQEERYRFNLTINAYMYADPLDSAEEDETQETEEAIAENS